MKIRILTRAYSFVLMIVMIFSMSILLTGCNVPSEKSSNTININGTELTIINTTCRIDSYDGSDDVALVISFANSSDRFRTIDFAVMGENYGSMYNLLKKGSVATGKDYVTITDMTTQGFPYGEIFSKEDFNIIWTEVNFSMIQITIGNASYQELQTFRGKGYIEIYHILRKDCPDKISVAGRNGTHYSYPGDSDYSCHYSDFYYPEQKIYFECSDGEIG